VKLKDIFLGILIVALIASELLLFSANQQKRDAVTKYKQAEVQLALAQSQLAQARTEADTATAQLRSDNQTLLLKNAQLQNDMRQLRTESQQLSQQLGTARQAVQLQQQHLDQLQTEQTPTAASAEAGRDACIANLHALQVAKAQWALENTKTATDVPTEQDLVIYLQGGAMPICPAGGTYSINAVGVAPSCSIPGHALPQQ
jgi:hypothetical protein